MSVRVTLRVNAVVFVTPPPIELTVTGKLPAAVVAVVLIVNTVEHDGVQETAENEPLAPDGKPERLKETG